MNHPEEKDTPGNNWKDGSELSFWSADPCGVRSSLPVVPDGRRWRAPRCDAHAAIAAGKNRKEADLQACRLCEDAENMSERDRVVCGGLLTHKIKKNARSSTLHVIKALNFPRRMDARRAIRKGEEQT